MPARNFYLGNEADVVAGSANFAARIAAGYAGYGLSAAQSAAFGVLNATLQTAHAASVEPGTRTSVAVAAKTHALRAMRAYAISLGRIVAATRTVSDAQLIELGLLPRPTRRPIGPPTTAPAVEIRAVHGRIVTIRVRPAGSYRRGIEHGTAGANLYSYVGPSAPTDPRDWHFERMTTRANAQVAFPADVPNGALVWLSARWVSKRGAGGPASEPVPFTLAGGAALPAAA
jgi:hypothetical protein